MEKIDAASMKEKTASFKESRDNSISGIINAIVNKAEHGRYSIIVEGLTDSQKKQLKELNYILTHDAEVGWLISWGQNHLICKMNMKNISRKKHTWHGAERLRSIILCKKYLRKKLKIKKL